MQPNSHPKTQQRQHPQQAAYSGKGYQVQLKNSSNSNKSKKQRVINIHIDAKHKKVEQTLGAHQDDQLEPINIELTRKFDVLHPQLPPPNNLNASYNSDFRTPFLGSSQHASKIESFNERLSPPQKHHQSPQMLSGADKLINGGLHIMSVEGGGGFDKDAFQSIEQFNSLDALPETEIIEESKHGSILRSSDIQERPAAHDGQDIKDRIDQQNVCNMMGSFAGENTAIKVKSAQSKIKPQHQRRQATDRDLTSSEKPIKSGPAIVPRLNLQAVTQTKQQELLPIRTLNLAKIFDQQKAYPSQVSPQASHQNYNQRQPMVLHYQQQRNLSVKPTHQPTMYHNQSSTDQNHINNNQNSTMMYSPISADGVQSQSTIKNILKSFSQKQQSKLEAVSKFVNEKSAGSRIMKHDQSTGMGNILQSSSSFRSSSESQKSRESSEGRLSFERDQIMISTSENQLVSLQIETKRVDNIDENALMSLPSSERSDVINYDQIKVRTLGDQISNLHSQQTFQQVQTIQRAHLAQQSYNEQKDQQFSGTANASSKQLTSHSKDPHFSLLSPNDLILQNYNTLASGLLHPTQAPTFYMGSHSKKLDFASRVTPAFKQSHAYVTNSLQNRQRIYDEAPLQLNFNSNHNPSWQNGTNAMMKIDEGDSRDEQPGQTSENQTQGIAAASILETSEGRVKDHINMQDRILVKKAPMSYTLNTRHAGVKQNPRRVEQDEIIVTQEKDRPNVYHIIAPKRKRKTVDSNQFSKSIKKSLPRFYLNTVENVQDHIKLKYQQIHSKGPQYSNKSSEQLADYQRNAYIPVNSQPTIIQQQDLEQYDEQDSSGTSSEQSSDNISRSQSQYADQERYMETHEEVRENDVGLLSLDDTRRGTEHCGDTKNCIFEESTSLHNHSLVIGTPIHPPLLADHVNTRCFLSSQKAIQNQEKIKHRNIGVVQKVLEGGNLFERISSDHSRSQERLNVSQINEGVVYTKNGYGRSYQIRPDPFYQNTSNINDESVRGQSHHQGMSHASINRHQNAHFNPQIISRANQPFHYTTLNPYNYQHSTHQMSIPVQFLHIDFPNQQAIPYSQSQKYIPLYNQRSGANRSTLQIRNNIQHNKKESRQKDEMAGYRPVHTEEVDKKVGLIVNDGQRNAKDQRPASQDRRAQSDNKNCSIF
ncbi:hypothetical protein FGO68_gene15661 [Halteria grandinella]|uniref:Uncharacterized protein n=1 Tax=Halteria grandinella TaxID=5974 RepID=A0A8J8T7L7_HALGN|nr:hypothetical protein FGO68_gene15661 [Halteria grandinella]